MGKDKIVDPAEFTHIDFVLLPIVIVILRCPRDVLFRNASSFHPKPKIKYSANLEEGSEIEVLEDDWWYKSGEIIKITWRKGNNTKIKWAELQGSSRSLKEKTLTNWDPLYNCFSLGEILLFLRECQVFYVPDFSRDQKIRVSDYINAYLKWYAGFNRVESTAERHIGEKTQRGYIEQRDVTVYPLELLDEVIKILAYVILNSDFQHYVMMEFGRSPRKHREQCIKKKGMQKKRLRNQNTFLRS